MVNTPLLRYFWGGTLGGWLTSYLKIMGLKFLFYSNRCLFCLDLLLLSFTSNCDGIEQSKDQYKLGGG